MSEQQRNIYTGLKCDRCNDMNAIRYFITTRRDYKGDPVRQDVDLCHRCAMALSGCLLNRIPDEERQNWIKAFIQGIIR